MEGEPASTSTVGVNLLVAVLPNVTFAVAHLKRVMAPANWASQG